MAYNDVIINNLFNMTDNTFILSVVNIHYFEIHTDIPPTAHFLLEFLGTLIICDNKVTQNLDKKTLV